MAAGAYDASIPLSPDAVIRDRLDRGDVTVPVLPAVAGAALSLLNDPGADSATIAATIRTDQSLAGHVMKFANSPLARSGAPIVSLQQAMARLGMRRIAEVALAACVGPKLFKAPAYARLVDRTWNESLATALWAGEIARGLRHNVEVSFLCGLLHQIGRPVVLQALQESLEAPGVAPAGTDPDALLEAHGAAAGLVVARSWNLPDAVAETIAHIADFRAAPRAPERVALVAAARAFALLTLADGEPDAAALAALPEMAEINLYLADIEVLLAQLDALRRTLVEMSL